MQKSAIVAVVLALSLGLGCKAKKNLDRVATNLRETVVANDYEKFKTLFADSKKVPEQFPVAKLTVVSNVLKNLGAFKEQSMKSISVKSGQPDQGKYQLQFEKGLVHLDIAVLEGKITSFRFHGDDFQKAARTMAPPLQTGPFFLLDDPKGKPITDKKIKPGKVFFALALSGIVAKEGGISFTWRVRLMSADKEVNQFGTTIKQPAKGGQKMVKGNLSHSFDVPEPGTYKLVFEIFDESTQRAAKHEEEFEVVAAAN